MVQWRSLSIPANVKLMNLQTLLERKSARSASPPFNPHPFENLTNLGAKATILSRYRFPCYVEELSEIVDPRELSSSVIQVGNAEGLLAALDPFPTLIPDNTQPRMCFARIYNLRHCTIDKEARGLISREKCCVPPDSIPGIPFLYQEIQLPLKEVRNKSP